MIDWGKYQLTIPQRLRRCSLAITGFAFLFSTAMIPLAAPAFPKLVQTVAGSKKTEQIKNDTLFLLPGRSVEREISKNQVHTYQVAMITGQYLRLRFSQYGIETSITLFAPDGRPYSHFSNFRGGQSPISLLADISGTYRLEVRLQKKNAINGRYEVKVDALREGTPVDENRVRAEKSYNDAERLRAELKTASLQKAIEKYAEALSYWQQTKDQKEQANALKSMGDVYFILSDYKKALDQYNLTLLLRETIGDRLGEAEALNDVAYSYIWSGESQKALSLLDRALRLSQELNDRRQEAQALNNLGEAFHFVGENQKALGFYNQALSLWRDLDNRRGQAQTLNNIGITLTDMGEMQKALTSFEQALPLWQDLGDTRGEAQTIQVIGMTYTLTGEYQKGLEFHNKARQLFRAMDDRFWEAAALNGIARCYEDMGEKQKALDYYTQALHLFRSIGNKIGERTTLDLIGNAYFSLGDSRKALENYRQSLLLSQSLGDHRTEAYALNDIGVVYESLGERQKALEFYNQALSSGRTLEDRRGEAETLNNIGHIYDLSGDKAEAIKYYNQALSLRRAVHDQGGEASTLYNIARANRDQGNHDAARAYIESALEVIESQRARTPPNAWRASYTASVHQHYEVYTDLLMQLSKERSAEEFTILAFQASEHAHARSLLESLSESQAGIRQGVDLVLLDRERSLQQMLNEKADRQSRLLSGIHTPEQAAEAADQINVIATEYQQAQALIRASNPRYAALIQPQPLKLQEIQQQVLDTETLLLEYALGDERSYLWAVTPTSITALELPKRIEIDAASRRVYELLNAPNLKVKGETELERQERIASAGADYLKAAASLSRMVLGPVASLLGKKRLLIVADGALQYIPFAALPIPRIERAAADEKALLVEDAKESFSPLVFEHEIVSLPSASVLALLRRELSGRKRPEKTVAVIADPVFEADDNRVKLARKQGALRIRATRAQKELPQGTRASDFTLAPDVDRALKEVGTMRDGQTISRLFFARREAQAIIASAGAGQSMEALDFDASRTTALSADLSDYRIIHFATHGILNSEHPELSGIVLSLVDKNGKPQDGFLRLHEIYNLNLPVELVVLSACQTGLGKEIKGDGLIGLTRGFMYAGAARVVASLWKVDDAATAELMKRFYQKMLAGQMRPAAALRAAQLEMWKQPRWQSPFYWSAFVLQGEWQ